MRKKSFGIYKFSLFFLISGVFFSCSQVVPEISEADYSVVFEYQDEQTKPLSRLCFFMESKSDVNRYDRIEITAKQNGYIWDINEIVRIVTSEKQWAGNTNIVVPPDEQIPTGEYEVTYYNADEKETSVCINVTYDESLYSLSLEQMNKKMESENSEKRISIYDENHFLIYYGDQTDDLQTPRDIWNSYRNAYSYNLIWAKLDDRVICIMPEQRVSLKK